jgi:hypothetical protein
MGDYVDGNRGGGSQRQRGCGPIGDVSPSRLGSGGPIAGVSTWEITGDMDTKNIPAGLVWLLPGYLASAPFQRLA